MIREKKSFKCLECGDSVTNGGICSCKGISVGMFGEVYSVEGSAYEETSGKTKKRGDVE